MDLLQKNVENAASGGCCCCWLLLSCCSSPPCLNNNYFFRSNDLMGSVEEVTYCILYQGLRKRMLFRYTTMWNGFEFDWLLYFRRSQITTEYAVQYTHVQNKTENCNYLLWLIHPDSSSSSWIILILYRYLIWILYSPCEIIWGMWHLSQEASRVCNDPRKTNWLVTTFSLDLTQLLKLEISIHIPTTYVVY